MQDFGDSIPGHGGITDRMDCQVGANTFPNFIFPQFDQYKVVDS